ncbi:SPOC like C-terminal domain-containing protein [Chytriomyces sp. MP71]|nr:SPOC like C-terminal domain-containing protein [Chytriomyces sp. MP71]
MSYSYGGGGDGDEEETMDDELHAEETRQRQEQQRDCLVYLIDASPPMHVSVGDTSPFRACLAAAAAQYRNRILNDHRDRVGIVLFGVDKADNPLGHPAINILQDLDEPSAARIAQLERLAEYNADASGSPAPPDPFETEFGTNDSYSLSDALWVVNSIFAKSAKTDDHKRVFLMTNTSNPHATNPDLQRIAITRAKDLHSNGAVIYLFGLDRAGTDRAMEADSQNGGDKVFGFDFDAFYKGNIVQPSEEGQEDGEEEEGEVRFFNASGGLDALTQRVEQKVFKKRGVFKCAFILGEGLEFGIRGYNLVSEVKPSSYTYLVGATNEEVMVQTSYICKTTSQQLSASDMDSYYLFGGEKAVFSATELAKIKDFGEPGIRLIGFKATAVILRKPYYNLKHSVFVVPDEEAYKGSSSIFIQLLSRLFKREKAAICSYMPRRGSSPRLVALLPQFETYDSKGNVVKPSGFHMIHIPFSDDLRKPPAPSFNIQEKVPLLEPAVKIFNDIIDKTTIKNFTVYNYQNPTLQKHYANLQAVALNRMTAEDFVDSTLPSNAAIQRRIGKFVPTLMELLPNIPEDEPAESKPKRKAPGAAGSAPKRAKVDVSGGVDEEMVKKAFDGNTLSKLTVPILTAFLKQKGQVPQKKKGDLVAQVEQFFESK